MSTLAPSFLIGSSSYLQVTRTSITSRTSSKFGQIGLIMGKRCHHIFSAIFDRILFIFAGNEDMYKSLNEFEIRPDSTTGFHGNYRVIMGKMLCTL